MRPEAKVVPIGNRMPIDDTLPMFCRVCKYEWDAPERVDIPTQRHICPGCGRTGYAVILDDEETA